jgi:hypothetical protein
MNIPMDASMPTWVLMLILPLVIWEATWKAIALWKTGRNDQLGWFVAMLLLNTAGILPIVYLIWFQRTKNKN